MSNQEALVLILSLIQNSSLILLVLLIPSEFFYTLQKRSRLLLSIFIGVLLGIISLLTRIDSVQLTSNISIDAHILVSIISGAVGGIPAALTTSIVIITTTLARPGENIAFVTITTLGSMLIGVLYYWQESNLRKWHLSPHTTLGVAVGFATLTAIHFMQTEVQNILLPIVFPISVLYGTLSAVISKLFSQVIEYASLTHHTMQLNRALKMTQACDRIMIHATEEKALLENICQIIASSNSDLMVWVGYPQQDEAYSIQPVAWAGHHTDYLNQIALSWANTPHGAGPAGQAIRNHKYYLCQDIKKDSGFFWQQAARENKFRAAIGLPLLDNENVLGVLLIYSSQVNAFDRDEVQLLNELSNDLAFGIKTLRIKTEKEEAQAALLQSERQQTSIFKVIPESIMIISENGEVLTVNEGFTLFSGYSGHEIIGNAHKFEMLWLDPQKRQEMLRMVKERGYLTGFEACILRKSGEIARILLQAVNIQYNGQPCILTISTDITTLKQAEEALRQSEHIKQILIDSSDDLIALIDINGIVLEVNEATIVHYNTTRIQMIAHSIYDYFSPETAHSRREKAQEAINSKHSVRFEDYNNGHWSDIIISPGINEEDEVIYLSVVSRDITGRKRSEKALQQSEEAYRSLAATLENRISNRSSELDMLYKISSAFNTSLPLSGILERALALIIEGLRQQQGTLYLMDESKTLTLSATYDMSQIMKAGLFAADCPIIEVANTGESLYLADMSKISSCIFCPGSSMKTSGQARSYLGIPLYAHGKLMGVLNIYGKVGYSYNKEEITLLEALSGQIAILVENYRLHKNMELN